MYSVYIVHVYVQPKVTWFVNKWIPKFEATLFLFQFMNKEISFLVSVFTEKVLPADKWSSFMLDIH